MRMHNERDEVGVLLCQADLALGCLLPAVKESEFEGEDAVLETVTEHVDFVKADGHDWVFCPNRSDWCHICGFPLISLITQFHTHAIHDICGFRLKVVHQTLSRELARGHTEQTLEQLVTPQEMEVQI